jgi:hypothetical protein
VRGVILILAVALAIAATAGAASGPPSRAFFFSGCNYSHHGPDDPIVFPREPGFSHDHTFVGNVSTNAFSTIASLKRAKSSCYLYGDTAAYWAPTLYVNGSPVFPRTAAIYYRRDTGARVHPFPPGLRMIAGNSHAIRPQPKSVTHWNCSVVKENFYGPRRTQSAALAGGTSGIPHCGPYADLQLIVNFPDCWNGKTVDSPNHKSHMAYSIAGRCPASHPVPVPGIQLVYDYLPLAPGVAILSSGGQFSGHADFVNSWNQRALTALVNDCLNENRVCGTGAVSASVP